MMKFICADAIPWLSEHQNVGSIVTSLPDASEMGIGIDEWSVWFKMAASMCMTAASPDCVSVFYQTDRKCEGVWHSKSAILYRAAEDAGVHAIWHKIILRRNPGSTDLHRPGYTNLVAFTKHARPGRATPDVIERGRMSYPNAMGENAAMVALLSAMRCGMQIVDPFCGRGTVPKIAHTLGMDAIGIDIDPNQIALAIQK